MSKKCIKFADFNDVENCARFQWYKKSQKIAKTAVFALNSKYSYIL